MKINIRKIPSLLLFILLLLANMDVAAQDNAAQGIDWQTQADRYLKHLVDEGNFSGSVLLAQNGEIQMARSYGYANREYDIPNTPDTKFRIGSLTKQFTAALILALEEQGKLSTDDYISQYLPNAPKAWNKIKIAHLLSHTSGIPNFVAFKDNLHYERLPSTVEQTVARFADKKLSFEPGTQFEYSNSGFVLAGYIAEQVTGRRYEDLLEDLILKKAGMQDTGYDHPRTILSKRASGYSKDGDTLVNAIHFEMDTPYSAGALYSTVYDLFKWDQALRSGAVISRASLKKMETPYFGNYGFGVDTKEGQVFHSGTISGFKAFMRRFPNSESCVVVLSNYQFSDPEKISQNLSDLLFSRNTGVMSSKL
ncbi:serine hydrolase domain-containing protein [Microbulbifer sp. SAOS-129_SWC]|uniref:serine hydrolase domain-containing protein n=1 Tax=Microbulbifer sp. SAOS-129_SWC TaxID=3145235 RepID=UPI00321723D5